MKKIAGILLWIIGVVAPLVLIFINRTEFYTLTVFKSIAYSLAVCIFLAAYLLFAGDIPKKWKLTGIIAESLNIAIEVFAINKLYRYYWLKQAHAFDAFTIMDFVNAKGFWSGLHLYILLFLGVAVISFLFIYVKVIDKLLDKLIEKWIERMDFEDDEEEWEEAELEDVPRKCVVIGRDPAVELLRDVAAMENCPEEILKLLVERCEEGTKTSAVLGQVALNENCSRELLEQIYKKAPLQVIKSERCPQDILKDLPNCEIWKDSLIRYTAATNENCPSELLTLLAVEKDNLIRKAVAENPNCPKEIAKRLRETEE